MNNIPLKLREELAQNPLYRLCLRREALHDHECKPNPLNGKLIEWEHAIIFASNQVQKAWAIIPICWWAHSGPGLNKHINEWIALSRASDEELRAISKARDYIAYRDMLEGKYGVYIEPKLYGSSGINYGPIFAHTESMWPEKLGDYAEEFDRGSYLVESDKDPNEKHVVDFEGDDEERITCTCDAFTIGGARPCKHIRKADLARSAHLSRSHH